MKYIQDIYTKTKCYEKISPCLIQKIFNCDFDHAVKLTAIVDEMRKYTIFENR